MLSAFAAWYNALAGIAASNHTYVFFGLGSQYEKRMKLILV
jgi:succinate-acetate transporter protein